MKRIVLCILVCLAFGRFISQDLEYPCGKRVYKCANGGQNHNFQLMHCNVVELKDSMDVPAIVFTANKNLIYQRFDSTFVSRKLLFHGLSIVNPKEKYFGHRKTRKIKNKECQRLQYAFHYSFPVNDTISYFMTGIFDEFGNNKTDVPWPEFVKFDEMEKIISLCEASDIASRDKKYRGKTHGISLEYSAKHKSFVWQVEKKGFPHKTNSRKTWIPYVLVDAITGQIVGYDISYTLILCSLPVF
jgi:hypothetical protein